MKTERLLQSVRQRRHRAALLRAAGEWITASFTQAMGTPPKLFIEEADGRLEPADIDTVIDLVTGLHQRAEEERLALVRLLEKNLKTITLEECPVVDGTESAGEEVVRAVGRRVGKKEDEA